MDQLYKQTIAFQHRCNDYTDDASHPASKGLRKEVEMLENNIQVRKNPHTLDSNVKEVIEKIQQAARAEVMSHDHADELIDQCEDFRRELQRMK